MKTKIISVILMFLLSVSITGCSGNNSGSNPNNGSKTSETGVPSVPGDGKSLAMEAYKAVLENKAEFFSTDNKKNIYLNDFLTNKEIYGTAFKPTRFAVLDMDGDKISEVVLELAVGSDAEFYEVLHYTNGKVYGYIRVLRGLMQLKTDGTFTYSNSAADTGVAKLRFEPNGGETDIILGYTKSSQNNGSISISYFINDKPVTEEVYKSFIKEQDQKKDAVWYEFSQKNIETELSKNP
jgi:hypothetical protein